MQEPDRSRLADDNGPSDGPATIECQVADRAIRERLLAFARASGVPPDDAEDLVQDVLLRLVALGQRRLAIENVFAFACGCLRRMIANERARRRRRVVLRLEMPGIVESYILTGSEAKIDVEHILRNLTPAEAQLLRLRYLEDRSIGQIASEFGLRTDAARTRIHRALRAARRHITRGSENLLFSVPVRPFSSL